MTCPTTLPRLGAAPRSTSPDQRGTNPRPGCGSTHLCFDNVSTPLGGAPIDKVLTATDKVEFRILGKSAIESKSWIAVALFTGNNVSYRGDTSRRVLVSRLEPKEENPEARTGFRHPDLRAWVRQERGRLVVAALTLLRAFFVAGCPRVSAVKGSFEAWSEIVPAAIAWAGGPYVIEAKPAEDADPEKDVLRELLAVWPEGRSFLVKELLGEAQRLGVVDEAKTFRDAVRAVFGDAKDAKAAGNRLRTHLGRVVDGRRLDNKETDSHSKVARWSVVRVRM